MPYITSTETIRALEMIKKIKTDLNIGIFI